MSGIRATYWLEGTKYISIANKCDMEDPEFWAATLSALVNFQAASAPVDVMEEVQILQRSQKQASKRKQASAQEIINRVLNATDDVK